ncbi:MAG: GTPase ObgE [Phycisphaerales bacterium]
MFVDRATVKIRSGKGGDGCSHLRREKFMPKGGPDGGNGGRGGDVVLVADPHLDTLIEFRYRGHFFAEDGEKGQGKSCAGRDGADILVPLPLGSLVYDHESGEFLVDMAEPGQRFVAAPGGRGGMGNEHFKTSTRQTPLEATLGEPAVERTLRFELKLIADVGLVGLPNAGKSTLLGAVSRANAKVGDYPFTTLSPQLGIAELPGDRRLVVADLPGLIEGAAEGAGLGHDFLRHVERTRVIVHLVDVAPLDGGDPVRAWETIRGELEAFSPELARKPELVVFNKIDLVPQAERKERVSGLAAAMRLARPPCVISGATREGVPAMLDAAWTLAQDREVVRWNVGPGGQAVRSGR